MPILLSAFVTTALVASIFVRVCTVALAVASLVVRDLYVPHWNRAVQFREILGIRPIPKAENV